MLVVGAVRQHSMVFTHVSVVCPVYVHARICMCTFWGTHSVVHVGTRVRCVTTQLNFHALTRDVYMCMLTMASTLFPAVMFTVFYIQLGFRIKVN